MLAIDLPRARRLAFGVVLGQVVATVTVALCAFGLAGVAAMWSALLGGGIATAGSLVMAAVGLGFGADARRALGAFYVGEALKLTVVAVLFVVVLKSVSVVPLAMFAAFGATFVVYWIALLAALPRIGAARGGA